jgi:hypothetical protein
LVLGQRLHGITNYWYNKRKIIPLIKTYIKKKRLLGKKKSNEFCIRYGAAIVIVGALLKITHFDWVH